MIAINKLDLIDYNAERFTELAAAAAKLFTHDVQILGTVPISARDGDGISTASSKMNWYQGPALLELLDSIVTAEESAGTALRLPVQDIYRMNGQPTVVGRISAGALKRSQQLVALPSGESVTVEQILRFEGPMDAAGAGTNVGVQFKPPVELRRGDVLCEMEPSPDVSDAFEGKVLLIAGSALHPGDRVMLRCSTQEYECEIGEIREIFEPGSEDADFRSGASLHPNEVATISFRANSPFVIDLSGAAEELRRFTLERENAPFGVGIVTQLSPGGAPARAC